MTHNFAEEPNKVLSTIFSDQQIKIDGILSEEIYQHLIPIEDFVQYHPKNGEKPTFKTQVYCWYDRRNIYFAFNCFDNEPTQIAADLTHFGEYYNNDEVCVYIDTFLDKQTYEKFAVNPRGVQNGKETIWKASAKIHKKGWSAEVRMPFKSLRFPVKDVQYWAVNFERRIHRLNETDYWTKVDRDKISVFGDTFGRLEGIKNIKGGKNIEVFPYSGFRNSKSGEEGENKMAYGLDFKYGITSNLTMDITSSPDYSEVESDPFFYQLDPYEVSLQERRPFFLEHSSYFSTFFELFYSRRIENPILGIQLTGKEKGYALGFLVANNKMDDRNRFYDVFRLSKDIFKMSRVGVIYSGFEEKGNWNRNIGLDFNLTFKNSYKFSGMTAFTFNRNKLDSKNGMYFLELSRFVDRRFSFKVHYKRIDPDVFLPAGYLTMTDYQYAEVLLRYIFRWEGHWLEGIKLEFQKTNAYTILQGLKYFDFYVLTMTAQTRNQIFLTVYNKLGKYRLQIQDRKNRLIWDKTLSDLYVSYFWLGYSGSRKIEFGSFIKWEKRPVYAENFTLALPGTSNEISLYSTFKILPQFNIMLNFDRVSLNSDNGNVYFKGDLIYASINYQISRKFTAFAKFQYDSYEKRFQYDFLMGYEPNVLSKVYLSVKNYSENRFLLFNPDARSITFKVSYLLRI